MKPAPLLQMTDRGLYCPAGDFYVDPHRAVDRAVVTHAHSDHARRGSKRYYCTPTSVGLMRVRLGKNIKVQGIPYREVFELGAAKISFHPAGHILGSAQVRIETQDQVWVVSGDFKREPDPSCEPFEVVPCDVYVTEATFGTPAFKWQRTLPIGQEIHDWWQALRAQGKNAVVLGYSLGKSQRILAELKNFVGPEDVWIHPTLSELTQCYRDEGVGLCPTQLLDEEAVLAGRVKPGALILAPPSLKDADWAERLEPSESAFASGWMHNGGFGRGHEQGFVISDHADWPALLQTIEETGAKHIYVLHRGKGALVKYLRSIGKGADSIEALRLEVGDKNQMRLFE